MGLGAQIYVGPYIEGVAIQRKVMRSGRGCQNRNCEWYTYGGAGHAQFCSSCGSEIALVQYDTTSPVDRYEVSEAIDEALAAAHGECSEDNAPHRWIPNELRDGYPDHATHFNKSSESGAYPISAERVAAEIAGMRTAFAAEIESMREFYVTIEVKWGVLVWWQ